jgi:hypothetical protein
MNSAARPPIPPHQLKVAALTAKVAEGDKAFKALKDEHDIALSMAK